MNQRIFIAIISLVGPMLAGAADAVPSGAAPAAPQPAAPQAAAGAGMYAYITRDGKEIRASLFDRAQASTPVAKVDDEAVTLEELSDALVLSHRSRDEGAAKQHDFRPVLERLIDLKLVVAEAREMGLDELAEVKQAIQRAEESQLIDRIRRGATQTLKVDPALAEKFYKDAVRQWNVRSLLFAKGEDSKAFTTALKAKKDFVELGKKAIDEKKATGTTDASYLGPSAMLPQVLTAVSQLKPGQFDVVKVNDGWAVVQLLGYLYPENPQARAEAQERARQAAEYRAAAKLYKDLEKKSATVDRALLNRIDFEAKKPGFAAFKKDKRALARIAGEQPLTVADLARGMEMKFFHGIEAPIREHRANAAKHDVFDSLLRRRLVLREAKRLHLAERDDFKRYMAKFTEATLFAAYVERVVMPDVKVTDAEGEKYYAEHKDEFAVPAMYRFDSIVFEKARDAEAALKKLRAGTDFKWLRANAAGQVKEDKRAINLEGTVVSANALPSALKTQLAGAKVGDFRMQDVQGQFFVVRVASVTEGQQPPYQAVRAQIGKKLINENLAKVLRDSAAKLRTAHTVAVYVTKIGF